MYLLTSDAESAMKYPRVRCSMVLSKGLMLNLEGKNQEITVNYLEEFRRATASILMYFFYVKQISHH